mmetsp:Transcript_47692/g.144209  ORF Transcript_47692/g.144209 Transcript_47692/m.144209 type:complete len:355 (-) Transcript_47692:1376-2440(-)
MGACTECRAAKVKCDLDDGFPCSRCKRLDRECIKHKSQQGKGRSKRKRRELRGCSRGEEEKGACSPSSEDAGISGALLREGRAGEGERSVVCSDHFGLNHLVRQWVSLAFRRRSFSLLSRAGGLAAKCGISMDQIMCETDFRRGMDFLYPILLTETPKQDVVDGPLAPSAVPAALWDAIEYDPDDASAASQRWIWAREVNRGVSHFYCSPGFERHMSTREQMEETYKSNQRSVVDLFLVNRCAQVRAVAHQIAHNKSPGAELKPCRQKGVKIRTLDSSEIVEADQVSCMAILTLDHMILAMEYVPPKKIREAAEKMDAAEEDSGVLHLDNFEVLDLGDLDDSDDMKVIYDLLSG